jgi:hypothetical protein
VSAGDSGFISIIVFEVEVFSSVDLPAIGDWLFSVLPAFRSSVFAALTAQPATNEIEKITNKRNEGKNCGFDST